MLCEDFPLLLPESLDLSVYHGFLVLKVSMTKLNEQGCTQLCNGWASVALLSRLYLAMFYIFVVDRD